MAVETDPPPLTDDDAPPPEPAAVRGPILAALEAQVARERREEWEAEHLDTVVTDERAIHWTRADLDEALNGHTTAEEPAILRRTDGHKLLYPGRHHDIHGEPSDGKSWIALAAVRDLLLIGRAVIWVDWEDTAANYVARLRALDVPDVIIGNPHDVAFVVPHGPWGIVEITGLLDLATELDAGLVVFDAMVDALALDGLDENSNADAARWLTSVCRPFNRAGITTLALDHVSKDPTTRGRGARGGGAKLGFIDGASYSTRMVKPFDRNTPGSVKLIIAKDRHGQVGPRGKCAAHVHITPVDAGKRVILELRPDNTEHDESGHFMPTALMERISRFLESRPGEELSGRRILEAVKGKTDYKRAAIDRLVELDHLGESPGPRGATHYTLLDPYREPVEPDTEPDDRAPRPDRAPPRPGRAPEDRAPAPPTRRVGARSDPGSGTTENDDRAPTLEDEEPW